MIDVIKTLSGTFIVEEFPDETINIRRKGSTQTLIFLSKTELEEFLEQFLPLYPSNKTDVSNRYIGDKWVYDR